MSIGSLSSSTVSTATLASADASAQAAKSREAQDATIADHVAAADAEEPIRSVSTTLGTLVDTYL
jgi:uncharacterized membrane protein (DUF4010 family)